MGKISELRVGQGNVEVSGEITELGNTRVFNKYGRELKVADAILKDDSGSIKLTLWNDDIMRFKEGDSVKVINGYVSEFQGEKQLTSGKFGRMEKVVGKEGSSDEGTNKNAGKKNASDENVSENEESLEEMPEEEKLKKEFEKGEGEEVY